MKLPEFYDGRALFRSAEIESFDDEEGTVLGRLVPYDKEVELMPGLYESFAKGAFRSAVKDPVRVKVRGIDHERGVVGHAIEIDDRDDGPWVRAKIIDTTAGVDLLKLLRAGSLDEISAEFRAMPRGGIQTTEDTKGNLHVMHKKAHLLGLSFVPQGAYGRHAKVTSVRSEGDKKVEEARAWLQAYRSRFQ